MLPFLAQATSLAGAGVAAAGIAAASYFTLRFPDPPDLLFADEREQYLVIYSQRQEKKQYGSEEKQAGYRHRLLGNTYAMQRSGRKRLYDHNIFLRGLFQGKISHHQFGNLKHIFPRVVFVDIGSAILYGEGAPTVRDLYEDPEIYPYLENLVATDINDPDHPEARYVSDYRNGRNNLPFMVLEIPKLMVSPGQVNKLLGAATKDTPSGTPVVMRSTNSGPDLFYSNAEVMAHFRAILSASHRVPLLYFFHKYILFKPAESMQFHILGEIDENIGLARGKNLWAGINWSRRKLKESFFPWPAVDIER